MIIKKIMKNIKIFMRIENHENQRNSCDNHENHENLRNLLQNHKNRENI